MMAVRHLLRSIRLGYLTGRAMLHIIATPYEIGSYCKRCNSSMDRNGKGDVYVISMKYVDAAGRAHGRECPVHVAWRELLRAGA